MVTLPRSAVGMTLAHAGLAVAAAGMVASTLWKVEAVQVMRVGETVTVAGYDFTLTGVDQVAGPNYDALRGTFRVLQDGTPVATLTPEKRQYPVEGMPTSEAGIRSTWHGDLYAVIGDPSAGGGFVTRLYYNPLVPWIWGGATLVVLGGLFSLTDRRQRKVSVTRRTAAPIETAPQPGDKETADGKTADKEKADDIIVDGTAAPAKDAAPDTPAEGTAAPKDTSAASAGNAPPKPA